MQLIKEQWDILCRLATDAEKPAFASALTACRIIACDEETLQIEVPIMYRSMFAEGHPDRVFFEQLLLQCLGRRLKIRVFTGGNEDYDEDSGSGENQRMRLYKQAQQHPLIQSLLDTFGADIVSREPSSRDEWLRQFNKADEEN